MLDNIPNETSELNELIMLLNSTIESINMKLLSLDQKNIIQLNYVPLITDASFGSATPKKGWVRSVTVSGITELQIYNGSAWVGLASKTYADSAATTAASQALADANSYADSEILAAINSHQSRCINYAISVP